MDKRKRRLPIYMQNLKYEIKQLQNKKYMDVRGGLVGKSESFGKVREVAEQNAVDVEDPEAYVDVPTGQPESLEG
jgi:hypothetical protein